MDADILPDTLAEVRQAIDALDSQLIGLLARRQQLVAGSPSETQARRAGRGRARKGAQVLKARREQAAAAGLSPDVAEAVWQAMIAAFIRFEQEVNRSGGTAN